jgi:hypothetical protein
MTAIVLAVVLAASQPQPESVLADLRAEYRAAVDAVQQEELARFDQLPKPPQAYYDRFGAVLWELDGVDVTTPVWDDATAQYPPGGAAAQALDELKVRWLASIRWRERLVREQQVLQDLEDNYSEHYRDALNEGIREHARATPGFTNPYIVWRDLEDRIDAQEDRVRELNGRVQTLDEDLADWDAREREFRLHHAQQWRALRSAFALQVSRRTAEAVAADPDLAFIAAHDRQGDRIARTGQLAALLDRSAAASSDPACREDLHRRAEQQRVDLLRLQAERNRVLIGYLARRLLPAKMEPHPARVQTKAAGGSKERAAPRRPGTDVRRTKSRAQDWHAGRDSNPRPAD